MTSSDLGALIKGLAPALKEYVASITAGFVGRLEALESKEIRHGRDGKDGADGKDGVPGLQGPPIDMVAIKSEVLAWMDGKACSREDVSGIVASEVAKAIEQMHVADVVTSQLALAVAQISTPRDGQDGRDGKDGHSVQLADVTPVIVAEVEKAVAAIPRAKDGVGMLGALIDRDGQLVVTLSDGTTKQLGAVVGRDVDMTEVSKLIAEKVALIPVKEGAAGKDGRDGTLENLKAIYDGERTVTLCFKNGDPIEGGVIKFVGLRISQGVYQPGRLYECGDEVIRGGSAYSAKKDTTQAPVQHGDGATDWQLVAQRGRDGKIGPEGKKGTDGKDGRPGRDLTQLGPDGSKW